MINHARTLLMNATGGVADSNVPGEQLVPASYAVLRLPTYLQTLRRVLFGAVPDRAMLNYKLAQYMAVIHSTELGDYVTKLDRRITYRVEDIRLFSDKLFVPQVFTLSADSRLPAVIGTPNDPDISGLCHYAWKLALAVDSLTLTPVYPPGAATQQTLTFTGSISEPVTLGRSGYSALVPEADGGSWWIEVYNRPQWDLGEIVATLAQLGQPLMVSLFGAVPVEPYKTFSNLFMQNNQTAYRLGGLLLAMIYRIEELRLNGSTVTASTIDGAVPVAAMEG